MQLQPSWQLEPVSATARLWLLALAVLLPMGIIAGTLVYTANDPTPKNLIADNEALTIAIVIGGTLLLCLAIHWVISRAMRRHQLTLDGTSEGRRGGKEGVSSGRNRGWPGQKKKKK